MSIQGERPSRGGLECISSVISLEGSGISYGLCHYCLREMVDPDVIFWYGLRYHQKCAMKRYGNVIENCTLWNCGIWDKDDHRAYQYPDMKFENAEAYQKWYDSFPYSSYHRQPLISSDFLEESSRNHRKIDDTSSENRGLK